MNDEDEDIVDFDQYVSKMREDGEWGGNVELVAASRVYKRDVRIYSGLYDGGVMLIKFQADEKEKKQQCDNNRGKMKQQQQNEYDEHEDIVYFGDLLLSYHDNDHYNSVHVINDKSKTDEQLNESSTATQQDDIETKGGTSSSMALSVKPTRKPRKGADCPCGSGIKYKKCCAAKGKSSAKSTKFKESNNEESEDEKKDDVSDQFRVLTI
jgi:hypothetical protein